MTLALKLRSARAENLSLDKTTTLHFSIQDLLSTFQHPSRIDHSHFIVDILSLSANSSCGMFSSLWSWWSTPELLDRISEHRLLKVMRELWELQKLSCLINDQRTQYIGCGRSTNDVEVDAHCKTDNYSVILNLLWTHSLPHHVCQTIASLITDFCACMKKCFLHLLASQNLTQKKDWQSVKLIHLKC